MNISRGGGYCDCGDSEAWKKGATCEVHDKEFKADEDVVPQDMQARLRLVAETVLIYAYQLLTWNKDTELPTDLEVNKKKGLYVMMLFNDETHTYEQVRGVDDRGCSVPYELSEQSSFTSSIAGHNVVESSHRRGRAGGCRICCDCGS